MSDKIDEMNQILKDQIQLEGFDEHFYKWMFCEGSTCLIRDVLRNQKQNLKEEWLKVRPMIED